MDSEHKHELKENDLQHFLANFGEFWKKYGSTLLLWVLLIALVLVGVNLYRNVQTASHDNAWDDLSLTTSPDSYPLVAEDHKNVTVKVLANLWGADAQLQKAIAANDNTDAAAAGITDPLTQAEAMYNEVLTLTQEPLFTANAYLGLAAVAESRRDLEKAASFYDKASAAAGDVHPAIKQRAEQRKAMLDRLAEPVVFGKIATLPPEVAPPEISAPEMTPPDIAAPEVAAPEAPAVSPEEAPTATTTDSAPAE